MLNAQGCMLNAAYSGMGVVQGWVWLRLGEYTEEAAEASLELGCLEQFDLELGAATGSDCAAIIPATHRCTMMHTVMHTVMHVRYLLSSVRLCAPLCAMATDRYTMMSCEHCTSIYSTHCTSIYSTHCAACSGLREGNT